MAHKVSPERIVNPVTILAWDGSDFYAVKCDDAGQLVFDMVAPATTPVVYNVTMTSADTAYFQALPGSCKKFLIRCRGSYDIKLNFTEAALGTAHLTVSAGMSYYEDLIQPATLTLWFECATAAQVVEIVAWS